MDDKPQVIAWMMDAEIAADDPLAAVKRRARAHGQAAEVLAGVIRAAEVGTSADAIDQAAALFGDPAFTLEESYAAAEAAMPPEMVNSASYVALVLREAELSGGD